MIVIKFTIRTWGVSALLFCASSLIQAQNMTTSPYSMFGIGELESGYHGQNAGMGGVAYGMRNGTLLNSDNPAALTALDSSRLVVDVSMFGTSENYASHGSTNQTFTGNLSRIALGGRILKPWYAVVGLMPYSSVGYYCQSEEPIEGTPSSTYTSTFEGSGGITKFYLSNAFRVLPKLSVGVNLSYLFGNLLQTETQESMGVQQKMSTHAFHADFGLQYHTRLAKQTQLTLGAVYSYRQPLLFSHTVTSTAESGSSVKNKHTVNQSLPEFYGVGGSLHHKKMYYALDYSFRKYSLISSLNARVSFTDVHQLKVGACYSPSSYASDYFWKRVDYKVGLSVSNSYMKISGKEGKNIHATLGTAFPVTNSQLNISLYYDKTFFPSNLFSKEAIGVTFTYTLSERFYRLKLE